MTNYEQLKADIAAVVRANGIEAITGDRLQQVLTHMVDVLGNDYALAGVATPTTNPPTPDGNAAYIAGTSGTYTYFLDSNYNPLVVPSNCLTALLVYDASAEAWTAYPFGTIAQGTIGTNELADGAVSEQKLATAVQDKINDAVTLSTGQTITGDKEFTRPIQALELYGDGDLSVHALDDLTLQSHNGDVEIAADDDIDLNGARVFVNTELNVEAGLNVGENVGGTYAINAQGKILTNGQEVATKVYTDAQLATKQDAIGDLSEIRAGAALGATAYQKPLGGIPESDLSEDVQTSLGKADTALQTETEPAFNASPAAGITAGDITTWNEAADNVGVMIQKTDITSQTTFVADKSLIINGAVVTNPSYTLWKVDKLNLSPYSNANYLRITARGYTGTGYSICSSFNSADAFLSSHIDKAAGITDYEVFIPYNENISYLLFTLQTGATLTIEEYTLQESITTAIDYATKELYYSHIINVSPNATGEFSLVGVVKKLQEDSSELRPSSKHRYTIVLQAGTYNFDYSAESIGNQYGLFLMPYTTIKGAGRGVTKIEFKYQGTDDSVMANYSVLNMPYTSTLQDVTLVAENIRYVIHSDGNYVQGNDPNYTDITLENVELIHLGINNGITPTFDFPSAWGGGTFNGNHLSFKNCRFEAYQCCPFLSHDRTGLVASSYLHFERCDFICHANANSYVPYNTKETGVQLNSWGSNIPIYVNFIACHIMRNVALIVTTTQGNPSAVNDYQVATDDTVNIIAVQSTNGSNSARHYITGGCRELLFPSAQTKGTPVRMDSTRDGKPYTTNTQVCFGVLLHDVAAGGLGVVMHKGLLPVSNLMTGTFTLGKYYGWSNGAWVEDNINPILRCISYGVLEVL